LKKSVEAGEVDVKTALRIEDHLAGDDCGPDEVQAIVKDVADMTNAQQTHYFTSARKQGVKRAAPSAEASDDHAARPGDVHQVLVTLAREDHLRLREWALRQRLTQDKAAARIINAFLHDLARVGVKGRAEAHSATANDRSLTR
jgi:hypothetical protein